MFPFFDQLMAFQRKHYLLSWLLCMAGLAGLFLLWNPCGLLPLWGIELLMLPMNLVTWPLFLIYLEDVRTCWKAHRPYPGHSQLQMLWWLPMLITTLSTLHLLASY